MSTKIMSRAFFGLISLLGRANKKFWISFFYIYEIERLPALDCNSIKSAIINELRCHQ